MVRFLELRNESMSELRTMIRRLSRSMDQGKIVLNGALVNVLLLIGDVHIMDVMTQILFCFSSLNVVCEVNRGGAPP